MKKMILFRGLLIGLLIVVNGTLTLDAQAVDRSQSVANFRLRRNVRTSYARTMKHARTAPQALPTSTECLADYGIACYAPKDLQNAYGLAPFLKAGYAGEGQTIVIIVSFGSPTLERDLKAFDAAFGLPDPPSLKILAPLGTVPFDPTNQDQLGWAGETSLDVQWAHAMAPRASIVVLTSPVDETQGIQGLPEFLQLEQYALNAHLGQIISQSWGTAENTLFDAAGTTILNEFEQLYERAAAESVTVLAAAGDSGTENVDVDGNDYPFPTVLFPASSPYVTAVGGTTLNLDVNGNYQSETVWNDSPSGGASGGGVSQYFYEPLYQWVLSPTVQRTLLGRRGIPDIAFNADPNTPVWVYFGFFPDPDDNGFTPSGNGTSAATPPWAGIIADANQLVGRPLGFLNPLIYTIGAVGGHSELFHDITIGNNAYNGLPGYSAAPGWDLASGYGTPGLSELLSQLYRQRLNRAR
jgi:subtilase family serine protease